LAQFPRSGTAACTADRGKHKHDFGFLDSTDDPLEVESGSLFPVVYPPGRMFVDAIDLKRLYEMSEPGVYTLDVSRFDEQSKATIRSKTVTLKIEP
jgi:hypothetical protein